MMAINTWAIPHMPGEHLGHAAISTLYKFLSIINLNFKANQPIFRFNIARVSGNKAAYVSQVSLRVWYSITATVTSISPKSQVGLASSIPTIPDLTTHIPSWKRNCNWYWFCQSWFCKMQVWRLNYHWNCGEHHSN